MGTENHTAFPSDRAWAREEAREKLKARYKIHGEYLGASTVALILGLGRTTVHDQVKSNRFVIPHRLINRKPMFLLDDLISWMVDGRRPEFVADAQQGVQTVVSIAAPRERFRHPAAEAAFRRVCRERGIDPDR